MAGMVEDVVRSLESQGWHLKNVTIIQELVRRIATEGTAPPQLEKLTEMSLLDMDLSTIGVKCLPDASTIQRISRLQGPKVLQVVSVRNILQSSNSALTSSQQQHARLLRICLTDGHSKIIAVEFHPIPSLSEEMVPGTKVRLENTVSMQSGILLLEPHSLCLLGGCVQSLYEEWEIDRKYSGFSRRTLKLPQVKVSSGPPPFERLNIEKHSTQTIAQVQLQVYKSEGSHGAKLKTVKNSTLISAIENSRADIFMQDSAFVKSSRKAPDSRIDSMTDVGSSKSGSIMSGQIRGGYELFRPKASQYGPPVEDSNLSEESVVETSVCTSAKTKSLLTENCKQQIPEGTMTADEVKSNKPQSQLGKNNVPGEGHPDVVNNRIMLVAEAAPVQNQAAAQKLLKKMSDTGREGGQSKYGRLGKSGARHSGKGKREEPALLTLDEWELSKGKMKTTSNRSDDVSQDAELAQQLQNQLDLEAADVNVRMAHDEAERIRMSMFNFGDTSNNRENNGRKPRGRGRVKRRFN